jgi:hypothetical protein
MTNRFVLVFAAMAALGALTLGCGGGGGMPGGAGGKGGGVSTGLGGAGGSSGLGGLGGLAVADAGGASGDRGGTVGGDRCKECTTSSQCSTGFCNRVGSSDLARLIGVSPPDFGVCSPPGDQGKCDCSTGYISGGKLCIGTGCPGTPVQLCYHLSGQSFAAGAGAGGAGGGGSGAGGGGVGAGGSGAGGGGAGGSGAAPADAGMGAPACTSSGAPSRTLRMLSANSAAALAGESLAWPGDPAQLRKRITTNVMNAPAALRFGEAYVMRADASDESAYLTLSVENVGSTYLCFIKGEKLAWRSADGTPLVSTSGAGLDFDYLDGAVGELSSGAYTSTCLGPGNRGYFGGIKLGSETNRIYSNVASVEMTIAAPSPGKPALGVLMPTGYRVCSASGFQLVLGNSGAGPVEYRVGSIAWVVFVDQNELPVGWTYVDGPKGLIAAGTQYSTMARPFLLSATATGMHVFADFENPYVNARASRTPSPRDEVHFRDLEIVRRADAHLRQAWLSKHAP